MRRGSPTTVSAASVAAATALLLVGASACTDESTATGSPTAPRAVELQASLGAVPTDGILDLIDGRIAAWAAKDAAAYAAGFATDLRFVNPLGALFSGRAAFQALHVALFNGPFAGSTLALAVREIQFLTGTTAIVHLDLSITGYAFLPPGLPIPSDGVSRARATWVVQKQASEWQVLFMQLTSQP